MSHVRTQIRDAVVAALEDELGDDATVRASSLLPLEAAELPVVLVYTSTEEVEELDFGSLDRSLQLVIEPVVQGTDTDGALDPLLCSIETAINGKNFNLSRGALLTSIEVVTSIEGATPIGRAKLVYEVRYSTVHASPETPI